MDRKRILRWVVWIGIVVAGMDNPAGASHLPERLPEMLGFDPARLDKITAAVDRAIEQKRIPGAVVLVGRRGVVVYARAAGRRAVEPKAEPMTRDTVFDMASLTKPVVTATSVMLLVEEGKLRLDDRAIRYLPELDNHGKGEITLEQLLRHRSGLVADNSIRDYQKGPEEAWKHIAELGLVFPPGDRFLYSDVGFLILGKLVERVSRKPLDQFAKERIFDVVGMSESHFRPVTGAPPASLPTIERIAPTESVPAGGPMLRGTVHDPRSRALGGVAGHAGLFSTADDLALFSQTLLNGGLAPSGRRLLSPLAIRTMFDCGLTPVGERRGLGWDVETSFSSPRGSLFSNEGVGHTGFTGTSLWIDPQTETFVILLTSRLHPGGKVPAPNGLRREIATLVAAAITDLPVAGAPRREVKQDGTSALRASRVESRVKCGVDVLIDEGFGRLRGRRVGLVTNHTGKTRTGSSTIDVLFHAPEVKLVKLFSPEHGIRGAVDATVSDGKDEKTGLPIVSLYSKKRKPTPEDLEGLDVLVFDIQDVGTRFYTYISTLGLVLEAVKAADKTLVVLDRPNPIGGHVVAGPLSDPDLASFIAYHRLPVRHGMTVGELARLYNGERKIGARLEVVRCQGWVRDQMYDQVGLTWIDPSPNMRSLTEALLYPGVGLLEATNLATGRGTDTPFERVGAPWIDPTRFAEVLNHAKVPGVRFMPISFIPRERQYAGERCGGVLISITNRDEFDPLRLGLTLAVTLRKHYPREWSTEGLLRLVCNRACYRAILDGCDVESIAALWRSELGEFRRVRARYLIYD